MQVIPLGSGSRGNATAVVTSAGPLLVDAGLELTDLERRLAEVALRPRDLRGLLLTHRHADHVRAAAGLARRHRLPVFATRRTGRRLGTETHRRLRTIRTDRPFAVDDVVVTPIEVPHDAPETIAFRIDDGGRRYAHVTDLGHVPAGLGERLQRCDVLLLEFNHDPAMLAASRYPPHLRARIGGSRGHLANRDAAALLGAVAGPRLHTVLLAHLSAANNVPELALAAARAALPAAVAPRLVVVAQDRPTPVPQRPSMPRACRGSRPSQADRSSKNV